MEKQKFEIGGIYYGSLSCAHGCFRVRVTKRTEKSVWFEHADHPEMYKPARAKVREWVTSETNRESANFHGWYISSEGKDNSFDMLTA